jgi:hypothetical protein
MVSACHTHCIKPSPFDPIDQRLYPGVFKDPSVEKDTAKFQIRCTLASLWGADFVHDFSCTILTEAYSLCQQLYAIVVNNIQVVLLQSWSELPVLSSENGDSSSADSRDSVFDPGFISVQII